MAPLSITKLVSLQKSYPTGGYWLQGIFLEWKLHDLHKLKYTLDILDKAGLLGAKPAKFPREENLKLSPTYWEILKNASQY